MSEADPARPPPYLIRPARPADVARLVEIENVAFDPTTYGGFLMNARSFRRQVGSRNVLLVAEQNTPGAPVAGYALGLVRTGSPYLRFMSLAVLPEHGGRGAGWRLFDAIERAAQDRGLRGVRLEIRADNNRLEARYKRAGYHQFAFEPNYYSDGTGAIRMVKDFAAAAAPQVAAVPA